ncbi:MAG: Ig-like domain-containing protein [Ruminiclostridium sp.]|nr:Ig-like domain-containing protein [Ruminiclostridium sp.]
MSKIKRLAAALLSAAMLACCFTVPASADSGNLVKNGNANDGLNRWTTDSTGWYTTVSVDSVSAYDSYFFTSEECSAGRSRIYQDINVKKYAGKKSVLSAYVRDWKNGHGDESMIMVEFLNSSGSVLDSASKAMSGSATWTKISVTRTIPKKAVTARISLYAIKHSGTYCDAYFDNVSFIVKGDVSSSSSDVELTGIQVNLKPGETLNLSGILSGETDDNILWKSSKTDVAKVSSDGLVTAKAKGTTVISATLDKTTVKLQVNVTK